MSIRNAFVTMAIALFAAGVAGGAGAQQRREGPCAADVKKFCGDVQPGQGGIAKCMKAHEAQLSPACQEGMRARAEKAERVREECKADVAKFCKGIAPGGRRILSCLKSRQPELQPECAAEFKRAGNRRPPAQ
jgi:cysteine rich repeat protein